MPGGVENLHLVTPKAPEYREPYPEDISLPWLVNQTCRRFSTTRFINPHPDQPHIEPEPHLLTIAAREVLQEISSYSPAAMMVKLIRESRLPFKQLDIEDTDKMRDLSPDQWCQYVAEQIIAGEVKNRFPTYEEEENARMKEYNDIPKDTPYIHPLS